MSAVLTGGCAQPAFHPLPCETCEYVSKEYLSCLLHYELTAMYNPVTRREYEHFELKFVEIAGHPFKAADLSAYFIEGCEEQIRYALLCRDELLENL